MKHFDVFLSYKNTDENGDATPEVALAERLYDLLTSKGINTFYSNQTIGIIGEAKYKSAIDDALDDASVLIAIGSSAENLNSNWVRYEWDSYYTDILSGRKEGQVISFIQNMSSSELPRTLRHLQTFDKGLNDIEAVSDFVITALKHFGSKKEVVLDQLRIVSTKELLACGMSTDDIALAIAGNDQSLYDRIPAECAGTASQWSRHIQRFPDFWTFVIDAEDRIIGNYSFVGLTDNDEKLMQKGELKECHLDADSVDNLYIEGNHVGFLMNLSVNPFAESSDLYQALWNSFSDMLKKAAVERGIYFSKIYYKAFLPEHEAKVAARGFRFLCTDKLYGKVFVHDMDPGSTLPVLDGELSDIYSQRAEKKDTQKKSEQINMEAMSDHMDFWKQIEALFYHPRFCRLKKYFMDNAGIPRNSAEYKVALSVAEWIYDILKYSSALLPFLPDAQRETHNQFAEQILNCDLMKDFIQKCHPETAYGSLSFDIYTEHINVKSITTFAQIWLEIDRLFMNSDLIDLRPYFYENNDIPPNETNLELCEGLAMRILTAMKISEHQLRYIPGEFVEYYYDYKYNICNSAIVNHVFKKCPFIKKELEWD